MTQRPTAGGVRSAARRSTRPRSPAGTAGPSRSLRRRPIVRPESDAGVSTWASADMSTTAVRPDGVGRDPPRRLDPVDPRHPDVHQHEIRPQRRRHRDGVLAAGGLTDDAEAGRRADDLADETAERGVIVDRQDGRPPPSRARASPRPGHSGAPDPSFPHRARDAGRGTEILTATDPATRARGVANLYTRACQAATLPCYATSAPSILSPHAHPGRGGGGRVPRPRGRDAPARRRARRRAGRGRVATPPP